jgi:uncharacterized membrane protein (DUF106 family)
MVTVANIINNILNGLLFFLDHLSVSAGLFVSSAATGIVMLIIFRYTSNQVKIKAAKDKVKAHILEIRLYKDSPRIILRALGKILRFNANYMRHALLPVLFLFVPVVLILVNLNSRYNYRGIESGASFIVSATLVDQALLDEVSIRAPDGVTVETPPLRIAGRNEVDWRLRATGSGPSTINFVCQDQEEQKILLIGDRLQKIAPQKVEARFLKVLLNPAEKPLSAGSPFQSIRIAYPHRHNRILGIPMHWLVAFFILSLVFAFVLKGPLRVEI